MNKKEIEALAQQAAKRIKTEQDLHDFSRLLKKITVEAALSAELDEHLGYAKHERSDNPDSRNGAYSKRLISEAGEFEIDVPRDRDGSFEPQLVKKQQRRFTGMDEKIHFLYAQGQTTREIAQTFKALYDADVSPPLISKVTTAVLEQIIEWQSRPLEAVYPKTRIQLCIVHQVRHSMKWVPWKQYRTVAAELKRIYQSATEEEALQALDDFAQRWDEHYPQISKSWKANWHNLNTLFDYPPDIRKAIYTTNAMESLNSVIRKAIKKRKLFPSDDSAKKVVYLAIQQASKRWSMPSRNWKAALNRFMIQFDERLNTFI